MSIFKEFGTRSELETKGGEELSTVLVKFADGGLLEEMGKGWHTTKYLSECAVDGITMSDGQCNIKGLRVDDGKGAAMVKKIVEAATEQGIPVIRSNIDEGSTGRPLIRVSSHIKEPNKAPEILLKALAAYAKSEDKKDLAKVASEAAERMNKAVSSYKKVE